METHRPLLFSIAYKMLGEIAEAEDVVQDVFTKYYETDHSAIRDTKNYLVRAVINTSINRYHQLQQKRKHYPGEWLPEPLVSPKESNPDYPELSLGMLKLLEKLNPLERAVFILRDVLGFDYEAVANFIAQKEANCRQIGKRARDQLQIREEGRSFSVDHEKQQAYLDAFIKAVDQGDFTKLKSLLHQDIVLYSDGGGKAAAARKPLFMPDIVTRFLEGIRSQNLDATYHWVMVNNRPGIVVYNGDRLNSVLTIDGESEGITGIYIVRNPDKLTALQKNGI